MSASASLAVLQCALGWLSWCLLVGALAGGRTLDLAAALAGKLPGLRAATGDSPLERLAPRCWQCTTTRGNQGSPSGPRSSRSRAAGAGNQKGRTGPPAVLALLDRHIQLANTDGSAAQPAVCLRLQLALYLDTALQPTEANQIAGAAPLEAKPDPTAEHGPNGRTFGRAVGGIGGLGSRHRFPAQGWPIELNQLHRIRSGNYGQNLGMVNALVGRNPLPARVG